MFRLDPPEPPTHVLCIDPLTLLCPWGWRGIRQAEARQAFFQLLAVGMWLPVCKPLVPSDRGKGVET